MIPRKSGIWFITLLFIFSGISGIIYEVIWVRYFGLVFGNTVFASSTVLSVFMTGLASGSWLFGKYVDRQKNALTTYVYLEIGIGIFGLLVPLCINGVVPLYTFIFRHYHPSFYQISLIRLLVSFFILIIPCTLMGGTLPVISKFITGAFGGMPEKQAGKLYAANTLGAVIGCLISGYFLIGTVGLIGTTVIAAFLNFVIAAAIFVYCRRLDMVTGQQAAITGNHSEKIGSGSLKESQVKAVIVLYAVSGFLSLFLEVAWTKAIVWVMGMDAYAFASMLSVFLFGLALGSFLVSLFVKNMSGVILKLGIIEALIGISVLISTVLITDMYGLKHNLEHILYTKSYWGDFAFLIALAAAIMAAPALLMGMAFPLALRVSLDGKKNIGAGVGIVYAANTIGAVFGALLAGFVCVPLIGVMKSIVIAGGIFLLVAAVLFMAAWEYRKTAVNAVAIALAAGSFILMFTYAPDFKDALARGLSEDEKLLYFKETVTGDVQVTESRTEGRILRIDGKQVASDGQSDVASHKYPAHLMVLLKAHPKSALIIAFGAGGTAGSILRYDEVERLDVVEICDGVIEPARRYFTTMNNGVLDDPRLHLIIQDGKNFVRLTDKTYDLIYSGPIHPQSNQGSAALYTKDFFADCRKRLRPGGIHCVWLPMHVPPEDYKVIVKSFLQVYPHSSMWLTTATPNTITHAHLIGSTEPLTIDFQMVNEKLQKGAVVADQLDYITLSNAFDFIGQYAMGEEKLREFTSDVTQINTDNLPVAEFFKKIGRKTYRNRQYPALLLSDIVRYKENGMTCVVNVPSSERVGLEEKMSAYCKGDSLRIQGHICTIQFNVLTTDAKESKTGDMIEAFQYYSNAYRYYSEALHYLPADRYLKEFFDEAASVFSSGLK
jgi:spermidine synthase